VVWPGIVLFFSSTIPWFFRESSSFSLPRFRGFAGNRLLFLFHDSLVLPGIVFFFSLFSSRVFFEGQFDDLVTRGA
jgi:hypothetical protein